MELEFMVGDEGMVFPGEDIPPHPDRDELSDLLLDASHPLSAPHSHHALAAQSAAALELVHTPLSAHAPHLDLSNPHGAIPPSLAQTLAPSLPHGLPHALPPTQPQPQPPLAVQHQQPHARTPPLPPPLTGPPAAVPPSGPTPASGPSHARRRKPQQVLKPGGYGASKSQAAVAAMAAATAAASASASAAAASLAQAEGLIPKQPKSAPGAPSEAQSDDDEDGPNSKKPRISHKSHTRRCREKVNEKFQGLLEELPRPPGGTEVKHKAQILDYTIKVLRDLSNKRASLETDLALSSRKNLLRWVDRVVQAAGSFQDAVQPFLSMYCTKKGWKCAELWQAIENPPVDGATEKSQPTLRLVTTVTNANLEITEALDQDLKHFLECSKRYEFTPRMGVPGRVYSSMRPEWLSTLENPEDFHRATLAKASGLQILLAVPVIVAGKVTGIAVFYDSESRPYDLETIELAVDIAALIGNAFGAVELTRTVEAPRRKASRSNAQSQTQSKS